MPQPLTRIPARPIGSLLAVVIAVAATAGQVIPRQVLFGSPDRTELRLSPDGRWISYLAPSEGVTNVWVRTIDGSRQWPVTVSAGQPVRAYRWAANSRQIIYRMEEDGSSPLFAVDVESGQEVNLTAPGDTRSRIVAVSPSRPEEVLVRIDSADEQRRGVWRIDVGTGKGTMIEDNDRRLTGLLADGQLAVRVGTSMRASGARTAFYRETGETDWFELATWGPDDAPTSGPLSVDRDGRTIYLRDARGADTAGLFAFTSGDHGGTYRRLAIDPVSDVGTVLFHPRTGAAQAVSFTYTRRQWQVLDPALRPHWQVLRGVVEGDMAVVDRDLDDRRWLIADERGDGPTAYHLYDRSSREATFLFTDRSALESWPLARMQSVVITARDGLDLVAYLSTPPGVEARGLPTVLLVHGGPWTRDTYGFNPLHQWLASRGYAVLSVNFRGSSGFGKAFTAAGDQEWSRGMHNDLIDAVNWAVEEGVADPDRVAIMGASYGGYAALVGLTFTPEYFAAGVDLSGPCDVRTLLESIPPGQASVRAMFARRVGSLDEPSHLESISPLARADRIVRPLLIAHGGQDRRVTEDQCRQIVESMQARGVPVTYAVFPDEGHGLSRPRNVLAFLALTEAFLARHLGGQAEPIDRALRRSSAEVRAGRSD